MTTEAKPKNKYRKGLTFLGMDELMVHLLKGKWVYYGEKVMHPSLLLSMTLGTVSGCVEKRFIAEAIDQHQQAVMDIHA